MALLARMSPAARQMAAKIPVDERAGILRHYMTAMDDSGRGTFRFMDDVNDYAVYSDGTIEIAAL